MDLGKIDWRQMALVGASSALTLVEPRRLTGWKRQAYWVAVSALVGAAASMDPDTAPVDTGEDGELNWYAYPPTMSSTEKAAVAFGAAGITFGLRDPLLALDAWSMRQLEACGVRHGRAWAAGVTAVAGAATCLVEAALRSRAGDVGETAPEDVVEPKELDDRVRQIVAEMLARTDDWGAPVLREQLASARQLPQTEQGVVRFVIDEEAPVVDVPDYWFPITGRADGDVFVMARIEDGRLCELFCESPDGETHPLPDELTFATGFPFGAW